MIPGNSRFLRVAQAIAVRLADLLVAGVGVVDENGVIVAQGGSLPQGMSVGQCLSIGVIPRLQPPHWIAVEFAGQAAQVVIWETGEQISDRLAQRLVQMTLHQTLSLSQSSHSQALKHKFIHDLLRGAIAEEADILRQGEILGMDFSRPRAVILIDASDYILATAPTQPLAESESWVSQRAQLIIDSIVQFFNLPSSAICAYIGEGEIAVLKASTSQDLVPWVENSPTTPSFNPSWANLTALKRAGAGLLQRLRTDTQADISLGIGRYHPGVQGLPKSYEDARVALSLGRRFQGANQVYCLDSLGIAAFVGIADELTKIDLARHLLSPLDHEADLLATLDRFFSENCCPSTTASRLSIHRNTLSYRLDKITSLIGLDPRRFDEAMQIRLALLLRSLPCESSLGNCTISVPVNPRIARQMSDALNP